jgi:hypothetical protein
MELALNHWPSKIYFELFSWPTERFHLDNVRVKSPVDTCSRAKNHNPLKVAKSNTGIDIILPDKAIDLVATVLVRSMK